MTRTLTRFALAACLAIAPCAQALPTAADDAPAIAAASSNTQDASFVTNDGVRLQVDVRGQGVPVLYLHGGPGSGSLGFETVVGPALESGMRMIYLDQRGSGRSASPADGDYRLERVVADVEALRRRLGIERWVVMAYSFGGLVAQAYAEQYPQHVTGLVLGNAILDLQGSMALTVEALKDAPGMPPLPDTMPLPARYFTALGVIGKSDRAYTLNYRDAASGERIAARIKAAQQAAPNGDLAKSVLGGGQPGRYLQDFTPGTAEVKVPVLLVTGDKDVMAGPALYARYRYPRQENIVLDGAHAVIMEQPEAFAQAVKRYLRRLPRAK